MTDRQRVSADYDRNASEYIDALGSVEQMALSDRELIGQWRDACSGPLLDAGCGPGHWTHFLCRDDRDATGVDLSQEFIGHARATYPEAKFECGDFSQLPLPPDYCGGILAWYSLIHTDPSEVPRVLEEFARVLRPGASLLLGFFDGKDGEAFDHAVSPAFFRSHKGMSNDLKAAGFRIVKSHRRTDPGSRPHAALIARKPNLFTA
ncbi:class I SAM-dependent methyltransferase [Kocuria atrinae]|uniref:class I SAM-dependent methyltransferase n=1 Tax=Kocuria atrinae TaxID=592377 RepID=UPI001CB98DED|nr:class I SAM-dependent methyltransferase [Kocuria atrinae]